MYLSNSFGPRERERVNSGEYTGWLVSPQTRGVPAGVRAGQAWAGDNACFSDSFSGAGFTAWLDTMREFADSCLFVVAPDVLGDWRTTWDRWWYWASIIRDAGFPPAFVGQDGLSTRHVPWGNMGCYFVGGTDAWKDSHASLALVREARRRGVRVHVGRCNTRPRLARFIKAYKTIDDAPGALPGFTVDGNGWRYPGKAQELAPAKALLGMEMML